MRRIGSMVGLGLAVAVMAPVGATAKQAPVAPLTLEIRDHAKLDKRTGVAHVRVEIRCAPFPAGYRVILAELTGGQDSPVVSPGSGGIFGSGKPLVCDGRKHFYTSDSFAPGVFGESQPPWVRGFPLTVSALLIVDSADGETSRGAADSETIRLH